MHKYTVELACEDVRWFNGVLLYSWFKWFILYTHTTMDVPLLCLQAVTRQCYQVLLILLNSNPTGHLCFDRETQHVIQKYKKTNSEWERTWNNQNQALLYRISQQFGAMFAFIKKVSSFKRSTYQVVLPDTVQRMFYRYQFLPPVAPVPGYVHTLQLSPTTRWTDECRKNSSSFWKLYKTKNHIRKLTGVLTLFYM